MVALDLELDDLERRIALWDKLLSLENSFKADYIPEALFDDSYQLDNEKEISRIYVLKNNVSIHDKSSWQETMLFLNQHMKAFEDFFMLYRDIIAV